MFKCNHEHRPPTRSSGFQCARIDRGLEFPGRFLGRHGGDIRGFEPAILFDLVIGHGLERWFGAHDNHGLEFTLDFSGFTPDEKLADIKFRHVADFPWKNIVVVNATRFSADPFYWAGSMAAVARRRLR
ncbi:hypothetical protein EMIT0P4_160050 [Pseudomonas sp. IT-P4]